MQLLEQLTCWDYVPEFTGLEAALAMVGKPNTEDPEALRNAEPVLKRIRRAYEGARRWFADAPEDGGTAPRGLLVSEQMQAEQSRTNPDLVAAGLGDAHFLLWLRRPCADFDRQTFSREVLASWVQEVGATSLYAFTKQATQGAVAADRPPQATAVAQQRHKPYNRSHFEALMAPCGVDEYITIDARGVWPSIKFDIGLIAETNLFRWKPAQVFGEDQDAPDVEAEPSLPFPFNARQLAAFMLDGVGSFIGDYYGDWEEGPDVKRMALIPDSHIKARAALKAAFSAIRESRTAVGCLDGEWPDTNSMVRQLLAPTPESDVVPVGEVPDTKPASEPPEWKARAAKRAAEIIASDRKKDLYPSQKNIADSIAKEFRAAGVVGTGGKPMSGAYIKRHALSGISSDQGKRLSTATHWGK